MEKYQLANTVQKCKCLISFLDGQGDQNMGDSIVQIISLNSGKISKNFLIQDVSWTKEN